MIATQNTKLNVVPGGILPVVHVSQYDVDRVLSFTLYDGNGAASIESGTTVTIEGTKPDGNGFQYAGTLSGNVVTVNTTVQMTAVEGTNECKLTLKKGTQTIGSALFLMEVEKAGLNEDTPISDTDLPLIITLATEQMERAETAATAAALSEENAEAEALKAEGYATGKQNGEDVSSESPYYHNNAEYYSEYAESIADRLPEGLSPKGTCVFADLPSISESIVGDMWVISDSFITTSDFRGGSGVSVPSGAYVYLTDSNKWDILPSVETVNPVEYEEDIYGVETPNPQSIQHQLTDQTNVLGAKNLIPYPYSQTTKTASGITFTDNGDGTVTVNGTATADVYMTLFSQGGTNFILPKGSYKGSGCPSGGSDSTYQIRFQRVSSNTYIYKDKGNGVDFEFPEAQQCGVYIFIYSGATLSNVTFKPMIRLASDPDSAYVPYAMTNRELTENVQEIGNTVGFETSGVSKVVGDTSVKFTDSRIKTTSELELLSENSTNTPIFYTGAPVVTNGSATYTFNALTVATTFYLKVR